MPWEIARGANLTSDGRIIDVYTKTGNLGDYTTIVALIPDYDLAVAINLAGPDSSPAAVQVVFSQLVQALLPVVDQIAKDEAALKYAGTYSTGTNSSITLSVDQYGLLVTNFSANGVDVASGYAALAGSDPADTTIRLYPTDLSSGNQTGWRAIYQTSTAEELASFDAQLFFPQGSCQSWTEVDLSTYGYQALDYFVFEEGMGGIVEKVEAKAWRLVLEKME